MSMQSSCAWLPVGAWAEARQAARCVSAECLQRSEPAFALPCWWLACHRLSCLLRVAAGSDACSLRVDLKGTLYHSSVLPLAGTAMVVHISATEAKVWLLYLASDHIIACDKVTTFL